MIYLYPTDTVYGLGVDARDGKAAARLRELKGSGGEKHYSIAVTDLDMMRQYAEVTPLAERLAKKFLPGKLTIVLRPKGLPTELGDGSDEIGVRIPNHPVVHELIRKIGGPITATSANVSGKPAAQSVPEILAQFSDTTDIVFDDAWPKELPPSLPSTVVDARGEVPVIIRVGAISEADLQGV